MSLIQTPAQIRVSFLVRLHSSGLGKALENLQGWSVHKGGLTKVFFLILSMNELPASQFLPIVFHPFSCTTVMLLPQPVTKYPLETGKKIRMVKAKTHGLR